MGFLKKILVLKQTEEGFSTPNKCLSGLCRLEIENGVSDLYLTIINIIAKPAVEYKCLIVDGKNRTYFFDLGARPSSLKITFPFLPDIERGFACGIYAESDNIPLTIAFGVEDGFSLTLSQFKKLVAEKCLTDRKSSKKDDPQPFNDKDLCNKENQNCSSDTISQIYNDEAVATENYFDFDNQLDDRLNTIKEWNNERLQLADEQTCLPSEKKEKKEFNQDNFFENETDAIGSQKFSNDYPYYTTVKKELDAIFERFEREENLQKLFPFSNFSKINYAENKYYVVGLIKENQKEKYICYGVPSKYSSTPPKELDGFCTFIPLSIFDLSGDGYWMMFQDAVLGTCIKPKSKEL